MKRPTKAMSFPVGSTGSAVTLLPSGDAVLHLEGDRVCLAPFEVDALHRAFNEARGFDDKGTRLIQSVREAIGVWNESACDGTWIVEHIGLTE